MSTTEVKLEEIRYTAFTDGMPSQRSLRNQILKRVGLIALVLVLTLLLTEAVVRTAVYLDKTPQSYSREFDAKYALAKAPQKPNSDTILLLGNSHIWHALFPELITHRLKQAGLQADIRNLGVNGATPEMNLFLLKKALQSGVRPRLVVYNVSPFLLNGENYTDSVGNPESAFRKSYLGQCDFKDTKNWREKWTCAIKKNVQFIRYREWVLQQLTTMRQFYFLPANKPVPSALGATLIENSPGGWSPAYELVSDSFEARFTAPDFLNAVKNGRSLSNFHWDLTHIRQLTDFCGQENIPLLMVWLPEHPTMQKIYRYFQLPEKPEFIKRFLALSQPAQRLWFLDLSEEDVNSDHFYNPDHLNVLGALPFSEKFAKLLLEKPYRQTLSPSQESKTP
jgi:hypothetical protein